MYYQWLNVVQILSEHQYFLQFVCACVIVSCGCQIVPYYVCLFIYTHHKSFSNLRMLCIVKQVIGNRCADSLVSRLSKQPHCCRLSVKPEQTIIMCMCRMVCVITWCFLLMCNLRFCFISDPCKISHWMRTSHWIILQMLIMCVNTK